VIDRHQRHYLNLDSPWDHQQGSHQHRIGQSGSMQPLCATQFAEPIRRPFSQAREGAALGNLFPLALMKLAKEILPVTLLRTLSALEG